MKPILSAERVSLAYSEGVGFFRRRDFFALREVSFELHKGETLGLLGRNGCGKSSLLRLLGGIIDPTHGRIDCELGLQRALLSLGSGFNYNLTGRDNVLLSTMLQGYTKTEALQLMPKIEEFAELGPFFDKPMIHYSSGMRTRLGFSTALIEEVDLLLIDEVMSVGDPHFRIKAEHAIKAKLRGHKTVVLISHNMDHIRELCDRVLWLEKGRAIEIGPTTEVLPRYRAFMDKC